MPKRLRDTTTSSAEISVAPPTSEPNPAMEVLPHTPAPDSLTLDPEPYAELKARVREAFIHRRLAKGYTEVLNAIMMHLKIQIYKAGTLDPNYERGLVQTLKKIDNPEISVHELPAICHRLVYDSIKDVPNPKKKSKEKPKKFFKTRTFGIIRP